MSEGKKGSGISWPNGVPQKVKPVPFIDVHHPDELIVDTYYLLWNCQNCGESIALLKNEMPVDPLLKIRCLDCLDIKNYEAADLKKKKYAGRKRAKRTKV